MTQFSVVIPLFNKRPHIERALESVFSQSYSPVEIIVVDDGSTDGSREAVEALNDPRIQILRRTVPGPGGYAARNLGIENATGDWIAFLDADDMWKPDHLQKLNEAIANAGTPVVCAFSRWEVTQNGHSASAYTPKSPLPSDRTLTLDDILAHWLDNRYCPIWTGSVAIKRDTMLDIGLFPDGQARRGGDKDMWLRAIAAGRSVHVPDVTAEFHLDTVNRVSNSTSHTSLPVINKSISTLLEHQQSPTTRKLLRRIANREITSYAKYTAGARQFVPWNFLTHLYQPEGLRSFAMVSGYITIGGIFAISSRTKLRETHGVKPKN